MQGLTCDPAHRSARGRRRLDYSRPTPDGTAHAGTQTLANSPRISARTTSRLLPSPQSRLLHSFAWSSPTELLWVLSVSSSCCTSRFLILFLVVTHQAHRAPGGTDRVITVIMTKAPPSWSVWSCIVLYVFLKAVPESIRGSLLHGRLKKAFSPQRPNALPTSEWRTRSSGPWKRWGSRRLSGCPSRSRTAVLLNEVHAGARFIRTIVTAMSRLPSIVAGLFIYATFIEGHWLGYSASPRRLPFRHASAVCDEDH